MVDIKEPDYYTTFKWDVPDDRTAADYIYGTHTGCSDEEIPKLVKMILEGEIPEEIMAPLRVLALNAHNSFIRYNKEHKKRIRIEINTEDMLNETVKTMDKMVVSVTEVLQSVLNIRDTFKDFNMFKHFDEDE